MDLDELAVCIRDRKTTADTVIDMARKIIHLLVDDLDGEVLESGDGESVMFSLDGTSYEIDLSEKNAAALRDVLQPWISSARRTAHGAGKSSTKRASRSRNGSGRDLGAVRSWAKENGHSVSERGRVPEGVLQAYDAAH